MGRGLVIAWSSLALLFASQALAADAPGTSPTLALTVDDVQSWSQVQQAMDACVAGLQLRNDPTVCRGLASWLAGFAGRVAIASKATVNPPTPPLPPAASGATPAK